MNGGGSVTLNFQRQPFQVKQTTVMVPWNRLVTMDAVLMVLEGDKESSEMTCPGLIHDHYNMRPVVLSTWQHTQLGACPEMSTVIPESQVRYIVSVGDTALLPGASTTGGMEGMYPPNNLIGGCYVPYPPNIW